MNIDKRHKTADQAECHSQNDGSLLSKLAGKGPGDHHADGGRQAADQPQGGHQRAGGGFGVGRLDDGIEHPAHVVAHGGVLHQLARLEDEDEADDHPPVGLFGAYLDVL